MLFRKVTQAWNLQICHPESIDLFQALDSGLFREFHRVGIPPKTMVIVREPNPKMPVILV